MRRHSFGGIAGLIRECTPWDLPHISVYLRASPCISMYLHVPPRISCASPLYLPCNSCAISPDERNNGLIWDFGLTINKANGFSSSGSCEFLKLSHKDWLCDCCSLSELMTQWLQDGLTAIFISFFSCKNLFFLNYFAIGWSFPWAGVYTYEDP